MNMNEKLERRSLDRRMLNILTQRFLADQFSSETLDMMVWMNRYMDDTYETVQEYIEKALADETLPKDETEEHPCDCQNCEEEETIHYRTINGKQVSEIAYWKHVDLKYSQTKTKMGRPSLGEKRKVSIVLPHEDWKYIETQIEEGSYSSIADYFRQCHLTTKELENPDNWPPNKQPIIQPNHNHFIGE